VAPPAFLGTLGERGLGPAEARRLSYCLWEVSLFDKNHATAFLKSTPEVKARRARMETEESARRRSSATTSAACVDSATAVVGAFDESGLTVYLKDVVTLCLENRPEDPVAFIADYLRRVLKGASPVSRAYQYLRLSPHHRRAFVDNAVAAHAVLCSANGGGRDSLDPDDHIALLREICAGFPKSVADTVVRVLTEPHQGDEERAPVKIDFFQFMGGVRACFAFEELLRELEDGLIANGSGRDFRKPLTREAWVRTAEAVAGANDYQEGEDERAEKFLECVAVALGNVPGHTVTFETFAGELFKAMRPTAR